MLRSNLLRHNANNSRTETLTDNGPSSLEAFILRGDKMSEPSGPIASLWRFDGTVSRKSYALVGFIGFAIKHNIDRYIARKYIDQANGLFNYWVPLNNAALSRI